MTKKTLSVNQFMIPFEMLIELGAASMKQQMMCKAFWNF